MLRGELLRDFQSLFLDRGEARAPVPLEQLAVDLRGESEEERERRRGGGGERESKRKMHYFC